MLISATFGVFGQLVVPFTQRTSPNNPGVTIYNLKGDFTMIGNTNLTLQNYGNNISNNNTMVFVDVDNDQTTLNSSSAELSLNGLNSNSANCSEVIYAGLYWSGRAHNALTSPNEFNVTSNGNTGLLNKQLVKLMGPNATTYSTVTATSTDIYYPQNSEGFMYSSYAEVTQYVQNNGVNGLYSVADIALNEGNGGSTGFYGGWGMVVIYANNELSLKDITVFDGHAYVAGGVTADFTIPLSGFNSTQSGPVDVKMGMMAGEGDRNIAGDFFQIRNAANTAWVNLSHGGNSSNNFFNSSIFTGGNARNPNLLNNTGIDISMFDLPNTNNSIIANNQTSTTFRYGTTQDTYVIFSIVFAVDAYQPDIIGVNSIQTINGNPATSSPSVLPGEELGYSLDILNLGNEAITNGQIIVPIPYNATFVNASGNYLFSPNSNTTPYFDPTQGSNGSIIWDIGALPVPISVTTVLAQLNYTLRATEDCLILANVSCDNVIEVDGTITGIGAITGTPLLRSFVSGFVQNGDCSGSPITDPFAIPVDAEQYVQENCSDVETNYSFVFCGLQNDTIIQTNQINGSFPIGTRFFDTNPVTTSSIEYTAIGFPVIQGSSTYFAYPQGIDAPCALELTITVIDSSLTVVPQVEDYLYCVDDVALPLSATPVDGNNVVLFYTQFPGGSPVGQIIPSTEVAGNYVYYAVEAVSNNCISSTAAPINVTVYEPGTASLSGINGTNDYSATVTAGTEICFNIFIQNTQLGQPLQITYTNPITGSIIIDSSNVGYLNFCWTPDNDQVGSNSFEVSITDNCGITLDVGYEIIVESEPCDVTVVIENTGDVICSNEDGSAVIIATGGLAPYTYTVVNNTTGQVFSNNTGLFDNLTPGNYTVFVVDANNCQPSCSNLNFDIYGEFNPINVDIDVTFDPCSTVSGGTITVSASGGTPGYLYSIGGAFQPSNTFAGLLAGIYTVTIMDANGCSVSASASVTLSSPLELSVSNVLPDFCGLNNGGFSINVSGGTAPYTVLVNGQPSNLGPISGLGAGVYQIEVTDANNCSSSVSIEVFSTVSLETSISDVVQPNCAVNSGSFNVNVIGGTSPYSFVLNGNQNNNGVFNNVSPGTYIVTTTDANGCVSTSTVTISAPLSLVASIETVVDATCGLLNGQISVNVSQGTAPYTYTIGGNLNVSNVFTDLASGTYEITVTDANLCSASFTVEVNGTPAFEIIGESTDVSCNGSCDGALLVSSSASGISYSWSNGAVGNQLADLCAGIYSVIATDLNGCEQTLSFVINEPSTLELDLVSTTNATCNNSDGAAVVIANGGTAPYTYSIAGSSQTTVITNGSGEFNQLPVGSYAYFVTDANGCEIECVQLFFISDDCSIIGGSAAGLVIPSTTQLIVTKSDNAYKVNYAVASSSKMMLQLMNSDGTAVEQFSLNGPSGKFEINSDSVNNNFVFGILLDEQGKIHATTRIR